MDAEIIAALKDFRDDMAYEHGVEKALVELCPKCDEIKRLDALIAKAESSLYVSREDTMTAEQADRRINELHEEIKRMAWIRDGRPRISGERS